MDYSLMLIVIHFPNQKDSEYDNIIDGLNNLKNKLEINNLKAVVPKF